MHFDIKLDTKSIDNLIRNISELEQQLDSVVENALKELAERGIAEIQTQLGIYGLGDSTIAKTLQIVEVSPKHYQLVATGKSLQGGLSQAALVEFGTGIVGQQNPHQEAGKMGYAYDINAHGEKGWWYPVTEQSEFSTNQKARLGESGDLIAWTKGMASRPFMFNTAEFLRTEMADVLRKAVKEFLSNGGNISANTK